MTAAAKKKIRLVLSLVFVGYAGFKSVVVLGDLFTATANPSHYGRYAPAAGQPGSVALYLALYLALPLHLTCVAALMQRPYLPAVWRRGVWWAVVLSGVWVGISFLLRKAG